MHALGTDLELNPVERHHHGSPVDPGIVAPQGPHGVHATPDQLLEAGLGSEGIQV